MTVEWAAGFFEGEGSVVVNVVRKTLASGELREYRYLKLSACQADLRPLEALREMFGGGIHVKKPSTTNLGKKKLWEWSVNGERAKAAFVQMRPHIVGRARAEKFDRFYTNQQEGGLA